VSECWIDQDQSTSRPKDVLHGQRGVWASPGIKGMPVSNGFRDHSRGLLDILWLRILKTLEQFEPLVEVSLCYSPSQHVQSGLGPTITTRMVTQTKWIHRSSCGSRIASAPEIPGVRGRGAHRQLGCSP